MVALLDEKCKIFLDGGRFAMIIVNYSDAEVSCAIPTEPGYRRRFVERVVGIGREEKWSEWELKMQAAKLALILRIRHCADGVVLPDGPDYPIVARELEARRLLVMRPKKNE